MATAGGKSPSSSQPNLQLKIATYANTSKWEFEKLTDLAMAAFSTDQSFLWRHPRQKEHPEYFRYMFCKGLLAGLLEPETWIVVAHYEGDPEPVGYGSWTRKGPGTAEMSEPRDNVLQSEFTV